MVYEKVNTPIGICAHPRPLFSQGIAALLKDYDVLEGIPLDTGEGDSIAPDAEILIACAPSTHAFFRHPNWQLSPQSRDPKFILVSEGWTETQEAVRDVGLAGYIGPHCTIAHLKEAIQSVAAGQFYYNPGPHPAPLIGPLTLRQIQVLELIGSSCTDHEIAIILGITETTVRHHLEILFHKLDVHRRGELISVAVQGGMKIEFEKSSRKELEPIEELVD